MAMKSSKKLGFVLLAISLLLIASVVGYAYSQSQNRLPEGKDLGEMMINWYIPDYNALVSDSDLIVVATVTNKTGIWGTDDGEKPSPVTIYSSIYTEYTFKPDEILKGNTTTIIGRVRGGTVDGYTQKATQTSSFEVGDKVLLFVTNNKDADGNRILWYHINWPGAFTETTDGKFTNPCYGEISIEQLKQDIADSETA
ncbi:hypothetical protein [Methanimicrococcus blatticola]|uniref:Uncharacterized protein n=1 Tax=Methanimicrococcus blatticola TaxID=91560 RepID=A0A484F588_9EURY|nr:hypothetical protein [Methanimicrococcus blatticola]MBZ3936291.1 hypothetical protein [Methanimicrococcus blatticola]MCC2508294.1 hypothetical protein [Methanimicrococcus blatticola]TDQ70251.1 hypothetical protein C7391_0593 [Methanimicrococcus blatticola]